MAEPEALVEQTAGATETEAVGGRIAERLRPGDVVLVRGELGAGKTTLIRGACRALGVEGPVTSPTFTIGQRYTGRMAVSHLDLYRLGPAGVKGEDPALLADYLTPDAIAFVEWPEAVAPQLGPVVLEVEISHAGGDRREIRVVY
ncbi:MAG: tRNA (adenosine(37)-N6)-threonylcarbamoyltransferase complex ATPase subunit type 1 TsaE [Solirubrobacterales bacterium]